MERLSVNERDFRVLKLLGKGKGGFSYLVSDSADEGIFVLKQIHHEPCDYYQFGDKLESELRDYKTLYEVGIPMPSLLDVDAMHERILKQYIPGPTVMELVTSGRMEDSIMEQVQSMCRLLYSKGLNIDYFPTNFVVDDGSTSRGDAGRLFYIDYECNQYMEKWDFEHWGSQYWARTTVLEEYLREKDK